MTEPSSMFRDEALRHRASGSGPGEVIRVGPRWITRAYWGLLVLVVAGVTWGALWRVDQVAGGPAVVHSGVVEAVVPAAFASDLRPGMTLQLSVPGRAPIAVTIQSIGSELADAAAAARLLGLDASQLNVAAGPLLVVRAPTPTGLADGAAGRVAIRVRSERLISTLIPGLPSLLGGSDG